MASFEFNAASLKARYFFRFGGRQYNKTLAVESERHAERLLALIEETLIDLERGKIVIPAEVDPRVFILTGGKVEKRPKPVSNPFHDEARPAAVKHVFDTYAATLTPGSKEANSIETEAVHGQHFKRLLGEDKAFDDLSVDVLQEYVDKRAGEGVVRATVRKELATLRVVWTWAHKRKHVASSPTWRISDLTLPKAHEKPPFRTWEQISRKIKRGGLTKEQENTLWECLWLDQGQTVDCLEWVRANARYPFIFPMFAFAAYTGGRRGELLRSERDDWDFDAGIVALRQKKADRSKEFTRRNVPIHPTLKVVMREWFENHPSGQWTIATEDGAPIGTRMATRYFRSAVNGGKWKVLHGWHVFRHSLASNMASAGVDQRIINEILGHHTEDMERRYRHLLPSKKEHALHSLFNGSGAGQEAATPHS